MHDICIDLKKYDESGGTMGLMSRWVNEYDECDKHVEYCEFGE